MYLRAGELLNGAPYGVNFTTGNVLFYQSSSHKWRVVNCLADATTATCAAFISCDSPLAHVPEGVHQWKWCDLRDNRQWKLASVRIERVPDAEARRRAEVCQSSSCFVCAFFRRF